ncbi:MAG: ABC transporter permease [Thermoleophilia bacterium]|nr:ABC transporter permease [Thermoleophilia bacterium]
MGRGDYIAKRVGFALITVLVAITLNFVLFRAIPGDAVSALRCRQCTAAFKEFQRQELGLDKSKWEQYRLYLADLAHGDLGRSLRTERSVASELWAPIRNTLPMVALGTFFSILLGVAAGVVSAWRRGTIVDRGTLYTGLGFYSMPPQWLGLLMVLYVSGWLGLPTSGVKDPILGILGDASTWDVVVDRLEHMVLPSLTLGLVLLGEYALITRSAMLETLGEDYALTARAKGLSNWAVVRRHGLRNALLPVVTLVALSLGFIIGGAITIEYVFSYPGIGLAIVEAIDKRDFPVLQGAFLLLTLSVIAFNLLADLLYFKLDPRVTT